MGAFVQSEEFKKLNIGFALDEGMQSLDRVLQVVNGEKTLCGTSILFQSI